MLSEAAAVMGDMTDEMLGHVENLTSAFHQIDAEQQKGNVVSPKIVKSTPVHVLHLM